MTVILEGRQHQYEVASQRPFLAGRLSDLYLAADGATREEVVLKVFRAQVWDESVDGFRREVDAVSTLRHKHILPVLDFGSAHQLDGAFFIALPYMKGGNLRQLLRGRTFCPVAMAVPLLRQVAEAIDFAHAAGVIHGDIKPENILLDERQATAYLADFGVSRHFDTFDRAVITVINPAKGGGTSAYLSPEQLSDNQQTPRSDLYSFGLVAYELLTGRLPFDVGAPLYRQIHARVQGELLDPKQANPALPDRVGTALLKALAADSVRRTNTAMGLITLLDLAKTWDVFIAYAGADREAAERLYDALSPRLRVFLDARCLRPGDNWDLELSRAQRDSLMTVALVSANADAAYYHREEVANAIRMARENAAYRVIPLFLDDKSVADQPYGLALKHGIRVLGGGAEMAAAADSIQQVVQSILGA